ncbi:MAG: hypothetical protein Kow00124_22970 [Anaerolineae bacterium]
MFQMPDRTASRFKALILVLMAILLMQKLISGELYFYIGQRFGWLALLAIMLMIALAGAYNLRGQGSGAESENDHDDHNHAGHDHDHEHGAASIWPLFFLALPLVLGAAIPARPLGAAAAETRGVATDLTLAAGDAATSLTIVPGERNVLDWVRAMSAEPDPAAFDGQEADLIGFVYRDVRFAPDQFMVARFTLSCCVADATAIGVVVHSPDTASLPVDAWVQVRGTFRVGELDGMIMPVLEAEEITRIEAPAQPYLYP